MKNIIAPLLVVTAFIFSSCDHHADMTTEVRDDGSIYKTILLRETNKKPAANYFGISEKSGWKMETHPATPDQNNREVNILYSKEFESAAEYNQDLNASSDTLFRMEATFGKRFRWFYTYLDFTETFKAADRFTHVDPSDFFTAEDYAFIERLPAEGSRISRADSLYAELLNKKIYDVYGMRGIFEDHYAFLIRKVEDFGMDQKWADTLESHKDDLFNKLLEDENLDDDVFLQFADSLDIPYPYPEMTEAYEKEIERLESKLNFMGWAADGNFTNTIQLPWEVIETNADSISGNLLTWKPVTAKFLISDFTMHATARKLNFWAVGLTAMLLIAGGAVIFRKGR